MDKRIHIGDFVELTRDISILDHNVSKGEKGQVINLTAAFAEIKFSNIVLDVSYGDFKKDKL